MGSKNSQFDYSTISDVVLSIRYTARDGGDLLRNAATTSITTLLDPTLTLAPDTLLFPVVLSCRSDFPTEWARAKAVVSGGSQSPLVIPITRSLLPYWVDAIRVGTAKLTVQKVEVADLLRDKTASSFRTVPRLISGNNTNPVPNYALEENDEGTGNLGTLLEPVVDRVVLLSIGKTPAGS